MRKIKSVVEASSVKAKTYAALNYAGKKLRSEQKRHYKVTITFSNSTINKLKQHIESFLVK